jgi:hypothetical protein
VPLIVLQNVLEMGIVLGGRLVPLERRHFAAGIEGELFEFGNASAGIGIVSEHTQL